MDTRKHRAGGAAGEPARRRARLEQRRSFELFAAGFAAGDDAGNPDTEQRRSFELGAAGFAAGDEDGNLDKEACEELRSQCIRVAADAELARGTLQVERQMREAELERHRVAWSTRMAGQLELQEQRLEADFKVKEAALQLQLLDAQTQRARLRGSHIHALDVGELGALEGELEGALQRVARMLARRSAEARVVQWMPSAKCQISLACMQDPVVAADGHSYERTAITTWLQANKIDPKSPATGEGLAHSELLTNWTLRKTIGEAREAELARGAALALDGPL